MYGITPTIVDKGIYCDVQPSGYDVGLWSIMGIRIVLIHAKKSPYIPFYGLMTIRQYSANMGKSANFDHETQKHMGNLLLHHFGTSTMWGLKGLNQQS